MGHHLGDYRCDTVLKILGDQLNGNGKQRSRRGVEDIEEGPLIIVKSGRAGERPVTKWPTENGAGCVQTDVANR